MIFTLQANIRTRYAIAHLYLCLFAGHQEKRPPSMMSAPTLPTPCAPSAKRTKLAISQNNSAGGRMKWRNIPLPTRALPRARTSCGRANNATPGEREMEIIAPSEPEYQAWLVNDDKNSYLQWKT